jgi:hypothetical protein
VIWQFGEMLTNGRGDNLCLQGWRHSCQANKDDTGRKSMLTEYQFAKVLVCRQQNGLFLVCQIKHGIVGNPRLHLGDIVNQVPVLSQAINDLPVYALVG